MTKHPFPEEGSEPEAGSTPASGDEELTVQDILDAVGEADADPQASLGEAADAAEPKARDLAAEHLADLQRLSAEYANYRKRIEREREAQREFTLAELLGRLLPVVDDLALAEAHGDLEDGPMAVIAAKLRTTLADYGLESVGAKGELFDPQLHEAIAQVPSQEVPGGHILDVVQQGYRVGERLIRAAKVAVTAVREEGEAGNGEPGLV